MLWVFFPKISPSFGDFSGEKNLIQDFYCNFAAVLGNKDKLFTKLVKNKKVEQ